VEISPNGLIFMEVGGITDLSRMVLERGKTNTRFRRTPWGNPIGSFFSKIVFLGGGVGWRVPCTIIHVCPTRYGPTTCGDVKFSISIQLLLIWGPLDGIPDIQ